MKAFKLTCGGSRNPNYSFSPKKYMIPSRNLIFSTKITKNGYFPSISTLVMVALHAQQDFMLINYFYRFSSVKSKFDDIVVKCPT